MSRVRMQLVALGAGLLLLSGCGSDGATASDDPSTRSPVESSESSDPTDDASETSSPSPTKDPGAGAPDCRDVWKRGARLPRGYQGCNEGRGGGKEFVPRQVLSCSSGQRMITYADHYWAVLGGTVHRTESRLSKDPGYGDAVARCRG